MIHSFVPEKSSDWHSPPIPSFSTLRTMDASQICNMVGGVLLPAGVFPSESTSFTRIASEGRIAAPRQASRSADKQSFEPIEVRVPTATPRFSTPPPAPRRISPTRSTPATTSRHNPDILSVRGRWGLGTHPPRSQSPMPTASTVSRGATATAGTADSASLGPRTMAPIPARIPLVDAHAAARADAKDTATHVNAPCPRAARRSAPVRRPVASPLDMASAAPCSALLRRPPARRASPTRQESQVLAETRTASRSPSALRDDVSRLRALARAPSPPTRVQSGASAPPTQSVCAPRAAWRRQDTAAARVALRSVSPPLAGLRALNFSGIVPSKVGSTRSTPVRTVPRKCERDKATTYSVPLVNRTVTTRGTPNRPLRRKASPARVQRSVNQSLVSARSNRSSDPPPRPRSTTPVGAALPVHPMQNGPSGPAASQNAAPSGSSATRPAIDSPVERFYSKVIFRGPLPAGRVHSRYYSPPQTSSSLRGAQNYPVSSCPIPSSVPQNSTYSSGNVQSVNSVQSASDPQPESDNNDVNLPRSHAKSDAIINEPALEKSPDLPEVSCSDTIIPASPLPSLSPSNALRSPLGQKTDKARKTPKKLRNVATAPSLGSISFAAWAEQCSVSLDDIRIDGSLPGSPTHVSPILSPGIRHDSRFPRSSIRTEQRHREFPSPAVFEERNPKGKDTDVKPVSCNSEGEDLEEHSGVGCDDAGFSFAEMKFVLSRGLCESSDTQCSPTSAAPAMLDMPRDDMNLSSSVENKRRETTWDDSAVDEAPLIIHISV